MKKTKSVKEIIAHNFLSIDSRLVNVGDIGTIKWIDPNLIEIDHDNYQRQTDLKHAVKIGQEFKYQNMKVVSAFEDENGILYATDGQHTAIAAALAGVSSIPVYVFNLPDSSEKERIKLQSEQFTAINANSKPMSKYDMYRNLLLQEDPIYLRIDSICKKYGVTPCQSKKPYKDRPGALSHIHNLIVAWTQIGEIHVETSFGFIRQYWPNDPIHGAVFSGLCRFFKQFGEAKIRNIPGSDFDETVLFDALSYGGMKRFHEVEELLKLYFSKTGTTNVNNGDIWRAKAIRMAYNDWIQLKNLNNNMLSHRIY